MNNYNNLNQKADNNNKYKQYNKNNETNKASSHFKYNNIETRKIAFNQILSSIIKDKINNSKTSI